MGKPVFLDPLDYISGKISRKYRTCYHRRKENDKRYTSVPGKRMTPVTRDELRKRERFAGVSRAVAARSQNLTTLTQDQENFIAQRNQPNGKKTFKSYIWSLELAAYDAQHQG